jgi:hypothetical protein
MKKLLLALSLAGTIILLFGLPVHPNTTNPLNNPVMQVQPTCLYLNPSRGWRIIQELQGGTDGNISTYYHRYDFYYNQNHHDKPDSIIVSHRDFEIPTSDWVENDNYRFYYDETGENLTTMEYYFIFGQTVLDRITGEYSIDGRIERTYISSWYENSQMIPYCRTDLLYDNDRINSIISHYVNTEQNDSYVRFVYTHDTEGRIVNELWQISEDSLNWVNNNRKSITYQPEDTSDGTTYINYLRDNYLKMHFYYLDLCPEPGTMTSEVIFQFALNDDWINSFQYNDTYDASGRLSERIYQSWSNDWVNSQKHNYTYDVNGNLVSIVQHAWTDTGWGEGGGLFTYIWEQYTATEDDVLPGVALNLSAYPNPFASNVYITLQSKSNAPVKASIYNIKGQLIKALGNGKSLSWDGTDTSNQSVSNGIYFVKAEQDGKAVTSKVIRIR